MQNSAAAFDGIDVIEWNELPEYAMLETPAYKLGPDYWQRVYKREPVFVDEDAQGES